MLDFEENENAEKNEGDEERADGLFKVVSAKKKQVLQERDILNSEDCSRFIISYIRDWTNERVCNDPKVVRASTYFNDVYICFSIRRIAILSGIILLLANGTVWKMLTNC